MSKKYKSKKYSILRRNDDSNVIIIWPDLPYWLYTNESVADLINLINNVTLQKIFHDYNKNNKNKCSLDDITEVIDLLLEAGALYTDDIDNFHVDKFTSYVIQYITFNITDSCNLYCKHCYLDSHSRNSSYMSFDDAKHVIDEFSKYMIDSCNINVSGGEALMNHDVIKILKYIDSIGKGKLNLVTNGTLITDDIAYELSKIKGLRVQVSLDGVNEKTHNSIRGKDAYRKTINGISHLLRHNVNVRLSPIVTEKFFDEIEEYFEFAKEMGINTIFLQPINNVGRAKENHLRRVNNTLVFRKVVDMYEKDPSLIDFIPGTLESMYMANIKLLNRFDNCGTGMGTIAIQPNGDTYPCPNNIIDSMKCGNLLKESIEEIWNNSKVLKSLRTLDVNKSFGSECSNCEVKHFCGGGCRGQVLANSGDLFGISYTCDYDKELLIEMLWTAARKPHLFEEEVERQLQIGRAREKETEELIKKLSLIEVRNEK